MKRDTIRGLAAGLFAAALVGAGAARAVDGVIEINDASILAAGGYPAVLGASGSYVLTGNLTPPPGVSAITVTANDVSIDLNGFAITGSGGALASGIGGAFLGLSVRNGSIIGFSNFGIQGGVSAHISDVHVAFNATGGISASGCFIERSTIAGNGAGIVGSNCRIENNAIEGNGGIGVSGGIHVIVHNVILANSGGGILTPMGSTIQDNVIQDNSVFGISDGIFGPPPPPPPPPAPQRTNIRGNTINTNLGPGVSLTLPALISENTVSGNTGSGVVCGSACTLSANLIDTNNVGAIPASGGAIVGAGSNVTDNSISFNTGFGLMLPPAAGYSQNTLNANGPLDVINVPPGPHPTSGFMNLCTGIPGPGPFCP